MKLWNKRVRAFTQSCAKVAQDYYPEMNSRMLITNAPSVFSAVWAIAKGWLDEKTRKKVSIVGSKNTLKELAKDVDMEVIPEFMGGKNKASALDDAGPWHQYELIDSNEPGAVVGVRRKDDPEGKIFTPQDLLTLPNPLLVNGAGIDGTYGALVQKSIGSSKNSDDGQIQSDHQDSAKKLDENTNQVEEEKVQEEIASR